MDCRAVIIFLCLLIAQANCGPVKHVTKTGALKSTIQSIWKEIRKDMQKEIRTALDILAVPGLLHNVSCLFLNTTELVGPDQHNFTVHHLSSFRCYMLEISELTPEVSPQLLKISQIAQSVEGPASKDCSLPSFEQHTGSYEYVRCLLELLDQRLSKAKF